MNESIDGHNHEFATTPASENGEVKKGQAVIEGVTDEELYTYRAAQIKIAENGKIEQTRVTKIIPHPEKPGTKAVFIASEVLDGDSYFDILPDKFADSLSVDQEIESFYAPKAGYGYKDSEGKILYFLSYYEETYAREKERLGSFIEHFKSKGLKPEEISKNPTIRNLKRNIIDIAQHIRYFKLGMQK